MPHCARINLTMKSPVPPAVVCLGTPTVFTIITLRQKERNNFVTWGNNRQYANGVSHSLHHAEAKRQMVISSFVHSFCWQCVLPGKNFVTPGPTLSTTPAASWPRTIGKGLGFIPFSVWYRDSLSVWQTLVAMIWIKKLWWDSKIVYKRGCGCGVCREGNR